MRVTQILIAALFIVTSSMAMAETKIAVLNVQGVLLKSNMANDFNARMERELKPIGDDLKARAEELKKMQEDGKRDADFLSEDQKRELSVKFSGKMREFQTKEDELRRDQAERQKQFLDSIRPKLDEVVNRIVQEKSIDLLLDRQAVLYASPASGIDISQEVLDALNAAK